MARLAKEQRRVKGRVSPKGPPVPKKRPRKVRQKLRALGRRFLGWFAFLFRLLR